jgi:endopeptidase La
MTLVDFNTKSEHVFLLDFRRALSSERTARHYVAMFGMHVSTTYLSGLFRKHTETLLRLVSVKQRNEARLKNVFNQVCRTQMKSLRQVYDTNGLRGTDKELDMRIKSMEASTSPASTSTEDDSEDSDYNAEEGSGDECQQLTDAQQARNMLMIVLGAKHGRSPDTRGMSTQGKQFFELLKKRSGKTGQSDDKYFSSLAEAEKSSLISELSNIADGVVAEPLMFRVLSSNIPSHMKNEILNRMDSGRDHENQKYTTWLDGLLRLPIGKYAASLYSDPKLKTDPKAACAFLDNAKKTLDEAVYGHDTAKHKLMQYISQLIQNDKSDGLVLGIQGPYGNGKTTLIEKGVSKVMGLPFVAIPLGGATDSSFLNGHGFTYEGSVWGQIANVLMSAKVSNPIIYLDELDKISDTPKGREVADQLVHLVDPSQNKHFQDRYFHGLDIDLSRVTWVFSYNDASRIHPVLRDRITEVNTKGFTPPEKLQIANRFLIPNIKKDVGITNTKLTIADSVLEHIITRYTFEGGVRKFKECLFDIVRDINMDGLRGELTVPNKRRRRDTTEASYTYDVTIKSLREKFLKHLNEITTDVVHAKPEVGRINGLYACSNDMGGITPIETQLVPSDVTFGLALTGNLGKVMKESAEVAKTLAWRYLTPERQAHWYATWKEGKSSVHIHCPEGAMSKDGPSAGTALTTCLLSMLTGNAVRNDVAITGEINLSGTVMPIGGLRSKLFGAKAAKCKLALFPKENLQDYNKIVQECPHLFDDSFKAVAIGHLEEALAYLLVSHEHIILTPKSIMVDAASKKSIGDATEALKMNRTSANTSSYNLRGNRKRGRVPPS